MEGDGRGLTTGGYESTWLANLVALFFLEHTEDIFQNTRYSGIYRKNIIAVFTGKWSREKAERWLEDFQTAVNTVTGSSDLNFTLEMCQPVGKEGTTGTDK